VVDLTIIMELDSVIPWSKETEPKLPYMYPRSDITCTVTHHGKIDAMFNYLNRVLFSYINDPGVSKSLQSNKQQFTERSAASTCLTIGEAA
jgi:hypothetical protein